MAKAKKPTFSPDPARFIVDQHLSALDIRVMAAIAIHDRFSANGVGCTAGHGRLASMVGCHLKSLSRSIRTLAERGYIGGRANPLNPRSRCYFIIYTDQDEMAFKAAGIGNRPVTHDEPIGNETATYEAGIGNEIVPPNGPIGNQLSENPEQDQEVVEYNIFSEAVINPVETVLRNPVETASSEKSKTANVIAAAASQGLGKQVPGISVAAKLAMIERDIRAGRKSPVHLAYLEELVNSYSEAGDDTYGRALRMLEQYGDLLEGSEDAA